MSLGGGPLVRFVAIHSVDDGKSSLGRQGSGGAQWHQSFPTAAGLRRSAPAAVLRPAVQVAPPTRRRQRQGFEPLFKWQELRFWPRICNQSMP